MMFSVISHWLILIHLTTETCFPWDFRDLSWRSEANLRKAMKNRAKPEKTSWKQQAAGWFFIVSDRFQSLFYSFPYVFVVSKRGNLQSVQSQPLWALWSGGPVNRLMDVSIYGLVPLWIELLSLVFRLIWGPHPENYLQYSHIFTFIAHVFTSMYIILITTCWKHPGLHLWSWLRLLSLHHVWCDRGQWHRSAGRAGHGQAEGGALWRRAVAGVLCQPRYSAWVEFRAPNKGGWEFPWEVNYVIFGWFSMETWIILSKFTIKIKRA